MDEIYKETLRWVNRIRRQHGKGGLKKLRKGRRDSCNCPVVNSLKDCFVVPISVGCSGTIYDDRREIVDKAPRSVGIFIYDFDHKISYQEFYAE